MSNWTLVTCLSICAGTYIYSFAPFELLQFSCGGCWGSCSCCSRGRGCCGSCGFWIELQIELVCCWLLTVLVASFQVIVHWWILNHIRIKMRFIKLALTSSVRWLTVSLAVTASWSPYSRVWAKNWTGWSSSVSSSRASRPGVMNWSPRCQVTSRSEGAGLLSNVIWGKWSL